MIGKTFYSQAYSAPAIATRVLTQRRRRSIISDYFGLTAKLPSEDTLRHLTVVGMKKDLTGLNAIYSAGLIYLLGPDR